MTEKELVKRAMEDMGAYMKYEEAVQEAESRSEDIVPMILGMLILALIACIII